MPQDTALHKMLIYTSSDKDRKQAVQFVIESIIKNNVQLGRGEIPFYINHALWQDEVDLAERLLEKANSWYEYSRIIDQMQESISQHKAKK